MKTLLVVCTFVVLLSTSAVAQEEQSSSWKVIPSIVMVKQFPGDKVSGKGYYSPDVIGPDYGPSMYSYSGTGLSVRARLSNNHLRNVFFSVSGTMTGYYQENSGGIRPMSPSSVASVGEILGGDKFTSYYLGSGVQFYFPETEGKRFLVFAGAEANIHFINAAISMSDQTKLGYSLHAGFDVSLFEFGVSYTAFSDIKNLGAFFGLRLPLVGMN